MKRESVIIGCSSVASRADLLNESGFFEFADIIAGSSLLDAEGAHFESRKLEINLSASFVCGQQIEVSRSDAQSLELLIEKQRVAHLQKSLLSAVGGSREPARQWSGTSTFSHLVLLLQCTDRDSCGWNFGLGRDLRWKIGVEDLDIDGDFLLDELHFCQDILNIFD